MKYIVLFMAFAMIMVLCIVYFDTQHLHPTQRPDGLVCAQTA